MIDSAKTISAETRPRRQQKKISPSQKPPSQELPRSEKFKLPLSISKPELLDDDGSSDLRFRQLLYDFSVLGSSLEEARAYLASLSGLTSPQYNVVMIIAQYQGARGVSVTTVARRLHVTTAFITLEAGRLERNGWIEKRQNPSDGRGILLRLTKKGESNVQRIAPERLIVNDHLFGKLSGTDFRQLTETLASLIADFSETIDMLKTLPNSRQNGAYTPRGKIRISNNE
jgi:DNA-binding MarR family transcriptional regulator